MKITISGSLGSGKSSVAKSLASKLNFEHFSMGDFQRMLAAEKGMSILEFADYVMDNPEIDRLTDSKLEQIGKEKDNFVVDSRLGWYFIPDSLKIFLQVSDEESARRIYQDSRKDEEENTSLNETSENIKQRKDAEIRRYQTLYSIDYYDPKHYDLLIDTNDITISQVVDKIISFIKIIK